MPMFKRNRDEVEQVQSTPTRDEPVSFASSQPDPEVQNENLGVFSPKTEVANNIILTKLNDAIKEMKQALLNAEPHWSDMELYVKALKEDIVQATMLKNHFKKTYN